MGGGTRGLSSKTMGLRIGDLSSDDREYEGGARGDPGLGGMVSEPLGVPEGDDSLQEWLDMVSSGVIDNARSREGSRVNSCRSYFRLYRLYLNIILISEPNDRYRVRPRQPCAHGCLVSARLQGLEIRIPLHLQLQ